jgi:hypothetical protein
LANVLAAPLILGASALYLAAASETIVATGPAAAPDLLTSATTYIAFVCLEFLIMALALLAKGGRGLDPPFFAVAVGVLLSLPFLHFGPKNDLTMRASIPALAIILFSLVDGWARPANADHRKGVIPLLVIIGAALPLTEIARSLLWARWAPNLQRSLYDVSQGASPNYLLTLSPGSRLSTLLREPVVRGGCPEGSADDLGANVVGRPLGGGASPLLITNRFDTDVLVKLRTDRQATILTVLVPAHAKVTVARPSGGPFALFYATGSHYSPRCQMFLRRMAAWESAAAVDNSGPQEISLPPPAHGGNKPWRIDLPLFLFD